MMMMVNVAESSSVWANAILVKMQVHYTRVKRHPAGFDVGNIKATEVQFHHLH